MRSWKYMITTVLLIGICRAQTVSLVAIIGWPSRVLLRKIFKIKEISPDLA